MKTEGQKQSQHHERRLAARTGGVVRPASGAFDTAKGDVRQDRDDAGSSYGALLIEHKWTGKQSFTLKASVLEKIVGEAVLEGRTPCLGFHLNGKNYCILTEDDLLEMGERARLRRE